MGLVLLIVVILLLFGGLGVVARQPSRLAWRRRLRPTQSLNPDVS